MPKNSEGFNKSLEGFLKANGFSKVVTLDTDGKPVPDASKADQFKFKYSSGPYDYGTVTITTHGGKVTVYYNESAVKDENDRIDPNWTKFLGKLKDFSLRNGQMGFSLTNIDNLGDEMQKRKVQKAEEQLLEGYYGTKHTSYNDHTPSVKMIIKHNKPLDETDQRYRYIEKIFLENELGERVLVPSTKPSVGRAFARHLAEGGQYNDERWNHIKEIAEDISKLGGFVRATRTNQFNESASQIVNEVATHYFNLRETIKRLQGSRGYNNYFENWQPKLMEETGEQDYVSMFTFNKLDPRIEQAIPVLNKLNIRINELSEANEFESWANSILEASTPETTKSIDTMVELLSGTEPLAVGPDAMNIKGQLQDLINDTDARRKLFSELESVANADPDNDAKPVIITWLQKNRNEEFYGDVLDKIGKSTEVAPDTDVTKATSPVKQPETAPAPQAQPSQEKAMQDLMPPPMAEENMLGEKSNVKKSVQRNFVAKHAQKSGAGPHSKQGYQRHDKHKKKLGEEEIAEDETIDFSESTDTILRIKKLSGLA